MTCELFRYEDEVIDTGNDDIDDVLIGGESDGLTDDNISTIIGPTQTLTMVGVGVTATAIAGTLGTVVLEVLLYPIGVLDILQSHRLLSVAPSGGITGVASVTQMIGGIDFCNLNRNPGAQSIQQLDVVNPGRGYTEPPKVKFKKTSGRTGTRRSLLPQFLEMVLLVLSLLLMEVEGIQSHHKLHLVMKHS